MALGTGEGGEQNAALPAPSWRHRAGHARDAAFVPFLYTLLRRGEVKPLQDYV